MLDKTECTILLTLSEGAGTAVSDIASRSDAYAGFEPRRRSALISCDLRRLEKSGHARRLDAEKPIAWTRTPSGTIAINTAK